MCKFPEQTTTFGGVGASSHAKVRCLVDVSPPMTTAKTIVFHYSVLFCGTAL